MMLLDELRKGIGIMLHPRKETAGRMTIKRALTFYYKLAIIPTVLYVLFSLVFNPYQYSALVTAAAPILSTLVLIPIVFFITAGLYHLFGKLFKVFKSPYASTFTAFVFGEVPSILFVWVSPVPILGAIITLVVLVWSLIVTILALSNQQKTSAMAAFGVMAVTAIVIAVVVFLIVLALLFTGVIPIPAA